MILTTSPNTGIKPLLISGKKPKVCTSLEQEIFVADLFMVCKTRWGDEEPLLPLCMLMAWDIT